MPVPVYAHDHRSRPQAYVLQPAAEEFCFHMEAFQEVQAPPATERTRRKVRRGYRRSRQQKLSRDPEALVCGYISIIISRALFRCGYHRSIQQKLLRDQEALVCRYISIIISRALCRLQEAQADPATDRSRCSRKIRRGRTVKRGKAILLKAVRRYISIVIARAEFRRRYSLAVTSAKTSLSVLPDAS